MGVTRKAVAALAVVIFAAVMLQGADAAAAQPKRVSPDIVCMVNDNVMGKPQIPVEVGGKTYYGCCQGCVGALKSDRSVRFARDPLTGREVDKSEAYIVEGPGGEALYFESAATAQRFMSRYLD